MATVLDRGNLAAARTAVGSYRTTCDGIFAQMQSDISALTESNFIGDASTGYFEFFRQITPALSTSLTGTDGSVTSMLENLLTAVEQMLDPVDPQLGSANQSAGNR